MAERKQIICIVENGYPHYEVHKANGEFVASCDTYDEAVNELRESED